MSDSSKVLSAMKAGLSPMDAQIFAQVTEVAKNMTPLELNRFNADGGPGLFPQLDTMNKNLNTRLGVFIRALALEMSLTAEVTDNPTGDAAKKSQLSTEEQDALDLTNAAMSAVEGTYGEERRAASNALIAARKALSIAEIEAQSAANNPSIGSQAQLAAKNAAIKAKNAVAAAANEDQRTHKIYTDSMRSLMPGRSGNNDPLGLAPKDPEAAAKPPPI